MQKQSFSKIKRHLAAVLVWALVGNLFLPMTTQATAVEEAEDNRIFEGLSFFVESDETTGTTAYTTGDNSVTVTTYAQAEADSARADWYRYHPRTSTLQIQNDSGKALRVTYRVEAAAGNDEGSTFTPVGTYRGETGEYTTDVIAHGDTFTVTMTSGSNSEYEETRGENRYPAVYTVTVLSAEAEVSDGEEAIEAPAAGEGSDSEAEEPQQTDPAGSDRIESEMSFDNILLYGTKSINDLSVNGYTVSVSIVCDDADADTYTALTRDADNKVTATAYAKPNSGSNWLGDYFTYSKRSSTVTIENTSGVPLRITYRIDAASGNSGSVTDKATSTDITDELAIGATLQFTMESGSNSTKDYRGPNKKAPAAYTVTVLSAEKMEKLISVTFQSVDQIAGKTPGSYTAKTLDGEVLEIGNPDLDPRPADTQYVLEAVENSNYVFSGWYLNDAKEPFSTKNPYIGGFTKETNVVRAGFYTDLLLDKMTLSSTDSSGEAVDSSLTKYDFVEASSTYSPSDYLRPEGAQGVPSTSGSYTLRYGTMYSGPYGTTDNKWLYHYYEDPAWASSSATALTSSSSGTAQTEYSQPDSSSLWIAAVHACAVVNSPVMRIKALEDIKISFDYNISMTAGTSSVCYLYYYIGSSDNATVDNIRSGTPIVTAQASANGSGYEVSVPKGKYLYLYAYGYFYQTEKKAGDGSNSYSYSYSAVFNNFTITPVNEKFVLKAGFQDNTGIMLGSGKLKVTDASAGTDYSIGSKGLTTQSYSNLAGTGVTLSVTTVPSGYVHIGWKDVTKGTTQYTSTYSLSLDGDREIYALFVPAMTITMGSNGYADATYQYKNLSGSMVDVNGQYVARNADRTEYYTSLSEAFSATNTVVLLAGDTFVGDFAVPSGKVLVVPYAIDDDGSTTPDQITSGVPNYSTYAAATVRGNLTVNGTLVVSARQYCAANGRAGGPIGKLSLSSGSKITVNGTLCAFGAIYGDGSIEANSGAKVYELMEIRDLRGIYQLYSLYKDGKSKEIFLFNSYFVKNIETETTYYAGAICYAHYGLVAQGEHSEGDVPIISTASDSQKMFGITSGSMTKKYDRANDRIVFRINENAVVRTANFSVSLKITMASAQIPLDIDTTDYVLPLCYGYGIEVAGDLTLTTAYKMLPGALIDVTKTGKLTVSSDLIFYRLNDYDIRSSGSSDTPQGFSSAGYPVTPARLPTGSTYTTITKDKVGSAKLNVDGQLIVNGGLYVTEGLYDSSAGTTSQFNTYANGYNYLTGTGKIIVNKVGTTSTVYEAQQCSSQDDVTFVQVKLSSIKGLPYEATADAPENYSAFTKTTYYGYINERSLSTWSTDAPKTLTYNANNGTEEKDTVSVKGGSSVTVAANGFTNGNYVFVGWNTDKNGNGTTYNPGDSITMNEDVTLYAMWRKVFTITWKNYNGKVLQTDVDVAEGDPVSYRGETPTKPEDDDYIYTFSGWDPAITVAQADTVYTAQYSRFAKNVKLVHADSSVNYYETVNDAVNASAAGETVVLLKNCTENVVIPAGKSLTLDLNGKNITATNGIAIENNGTLNIQGNGTVSATSFGSAISNSGSIGTISGGTFVGVEDGLKIASGASVGTISGGTFKGKYAIQAAGTVDAITNGTFTGTTSGLYINGGTVTSISGGTFTGLEGLLFSATGGSVGTISGGSFTGSEMGVYVSPNGVLTKVTGGTFVSTSTAGGDNSYAVKNTSSTPIQFTATGAPETSNYVGPLFKAVAGTRAGTLSDPDTNYTYPTGMTLSGKANTDGYFYIAPNVFTLHFEPNSVSAQGTIADQTANRTSGSITLPASGFTRNNYVFVGWSLDQNAGYADASVLKPDFEGKITVDLSTLNNPALNQTVTLYAVWKQDFAYSVTVTWGDLSFTYQPTIYKWDGEKMQYVEQPGGWNADGDNTVKIANNTEIANNENLESGNVQVRIDYQKVDSQYNVNINDVEMGSSGMILSNKLSPGSDITAIVLLTGTPPNDSSASNVTVGKLTLALTPADG